MVRVRVLEVLLAEAYPQLPWAASNDAWRSSMERQFNIQQLEEKFQRTPNSVQKKEWPIANFLNKQKVDNEVKHLQIVLDNKVKSVYKPERKSVVDKLLILCKAKDIDQLNAMWNSLGYKYVTKAGEQKAQKFHPRILWRILIKKNQEFILRGYNW